MILRELIRAYPNFVTKERLTAIIYGHGGSEHAENNIETYICRLKPRLSGLQFVIGNSRGVGYRLEKKEARA